MSSRRDSLPETKPILGGSALVFFVSLFSLCQVVSDWILAFSRKGTWDFRFYVVFYRWGLESAPNNRLQIVKPFAV